jgi:cell division protein FtsB
MKGSTSGKDVKKQAGRDPWGAKERKKREAGKKRARAAQRVAPAPTAAPAAKAGKAARPAVQSARPAKPAKDTSATATQRKPHSSRDKARTANPRRRVTRSLLTLAALIIVGVVLAGPVMRNLDASREIRAKQAELEREKAVTEDLETRKAEANDIGFLEKEARRIGYVLPGEIPVVVVEEAVQEQAAAAGSGNGTDPAGSTPQP